MCFGYAGKQYVRRAPLQQGGDGLAEKHCEVYFSAKEVCGIGFPGLRSETGGTHNRFLVVGCQKHAMWSQGFISGKSTFDW